MNTKEIIENYSLKPCGCIDEKCLEYIVENVELFEDRYSISLYYMDTDRCSLRMADDSLFDEIVETASDYLEYNDMNNDTILDDVEEIFG